MWAWLNFLSFPFKYLWGHHHSRHSQRSADASTISWPLTPRRLRHSQGSSYTPWTWHWYDLDREREKRQYVRICWHTALLQCYFSRFLGFSHADDMVRHTLTLVSHIGFVSTELIFVDTAHTHERTYTNVTDLQVVSTVPVSSEGVLRSPVCIPHGLTG